MNVLKTSVGILTIGPKLSDTMDPQFRRFVGSAITETIGSAVLFGFRSSFCVVSCRHVVEPRLGEDMFKAVFKYLDQAGVLKRAVLGLDERALRFHPSDTHSATYDIAAFWFHVQGATVLPFPFLEIQPRQYYPQRVAYLGLQMWGYPIQDLTKDAVLTEDTPLPLRILQAKLIDAAHTRSQAPNFSKMHIAQHVAEIQTLEDLSGMSGGLVLAEEGSALYPVGMMTTSGRGRVQNRLDRTERNAPFVGFIDFPTILETLK